MLKKVSQVIEVDNLLEQTYRQRVEQQRLQYDEVQWQAVQKLQHTLNKLLLFANYRHKLLARKFRFKHKTDCPSLYLFGDVGRGKSMLMDLFYEACPLEQKKRVYFHRFMLDVHAFIHQAHILHQHNAINILAQKIRDEATLLCFDEFHLNNIADAMLLHSLFKQLFSLGVVIIMTSNRHPNDLYQGGLQQEQFLSFAALLQNQVDIIELNAHTDYRLRHAPHTNTHYYFPLDNHADTFIQQHYNQLTNHAKKYPAVLQLLGRELSLSAIHNNVALLSFDELCVQPLGAADYLELAQRFTVLLITDIPKLSAEKRNEAKRFITLIDALYEHKVQLFCTAEVEASALYTEGEGVFEFKRTVSRLMEMQSVAWTVKT
ncbi:Cell division protein ZapE [uncultured bacterium]|nr:Cell division protein ZapE [uncultured bacterium]